MLKRKHIPIAEARRLLDYDPDTGVFRWRVRRLGNSFVGSIAGYEDGGYRYVGLCENIYLEHRLAWAMYYGTQPPSVIDHIDRDKTNNRIANLREATSSENAQNRTPVKGVYWNKAGFWDAQKQVRGKLYRANSSKSAEEAIARLQIRLRNAGHTGVKFQTT